jgi:DNA-binding NarL/FixJ family response regulator
MSECPEPIDVVIADDHALFREGLRKLLESEQGIHVVGEAADGEQTVRLVRQLNPHVLLLDFSFPNMTGIEVLRDLKDQGLRTHTLLVTAAIERDQIVEALQLGASGVVLKHAALPVLLKSIDCVMAGQYWIGQEAVSDLVHALRRTRPSSARSGVPLEFGLTAREKEVLALIVGGYTNKDVARKLKISENTAKHHLTNIFDKLGVSNRLELVLFAVNHGLSDEK